MAQRQRRLTAADELALANAAANAAFEGHDIPESDRTLACSYLAGDLDHDTYRRRAHELIVEDLSEVHDGRLGWTPSPMRAGHHRRHGSG